MTFRAMLGRWAGPLMVHNLNEQRALERAAAAQAMGLDPMTYGNPLPGGTTTNTTTNTSTETNGWLKGALVGAALLAGGAAAGLAATGVLKPAPPAASSAAEASQPAAAPDRPPVAAAAANPAWDEITEIQLPDGTWKQTGRRPLTKQPDGTYK